MTGGDNPREEWPLVFDPGSAKLRKERYSPQQRVRIR
jgi:hypothetical protein